MFASEWRVTWTKDGFVKPQKKIFQTEQNRDRHLSWLNENAYRVVAVERRPVGKWQPVSCPDGPAR